MAAAIAHCAWWIGCSCSRIVLRCSLDRFKNIGDAFQGGYYIQGDNDKSTGDQGFLTNLPVTVHVAMDGRYDHAARAPDGFTAAGATMDFTHGSDTLRNPIYTNWYPQGRVTFRFKNDNKQMNGIFIVLHHQFDI